MKTMNHKKRIIVTPIPVPTSLAAAQADFEIVPAITDGSLAQSFDGREETAAITDPRNKRLTMLMTQVIFRQ